MTRQNFCNIFDNERYNLAASVSLTEVMKVMSYTEL